VYRVVVRAKKDADAARAMLSRYYSGWGVRARTHIPPFIPASERPR